jgi:hypothetical protein
MRDTNKDPPMVVRRKPNRVGAFLLSYAFGAWIINTIYRERYYLSSIFYDTYITGTTSRSATICADDLIQYHRVHVDESNKEDGNISRNQLLPPSTTSTIRQPPPRRKSHNSRSNNTLSSPSSSTSSLQFWNDGNLAYVRSDKYLHRYPSQIDESRAVKVSPFIHDYNDPNNDHYADGITIRVVYFVNTKINPNYDEWIYHQFGVFGRHPAVKEIHIVADTMSCSRREDKLSRAYQWLQRARGNETHIYLTCHDDAVELYEYHGIHKLWEIGQQYNEHTDVAIYFHSKGLTHGSTWDEYTKDDEHGIHSIFTETIFSQPAMDRIIEAFQLFPTIDKAGMECSNCT